MQGSGETLKLRWLEIFHAVAEAGSLTRAAERMGIAQPTVSHAIDELEHSLELQLLHRRRSGSALTPEGERLAEEAERILSACEHFRQLASDLATGRIGQLQIGCLPGLSQAFLPELLGRFVQRFPDAQVSMRTHGSDRIERWVAGGHWDLGIIERPDTNPALHVSPLTIPVVCLLPPDHALTEKAVIELDDLRNQPLVTLLASHPTTRKLRTLAQEAGLPLHFKADSYLFPPAAAMIAAGIGIGLVDAVTALYTPGLRAVWRPFRPSLSFELAIIRPARERRSKLCQAFLKHLDNELSDLATQVRGIERNGRSPGSK